VYPRSSLVEMVLRGNHCLYVLVLLWWGGRITKKTEISSFIVDQFTSKDMTLVFKIALKCLQMINILLITYLYTAFQLAILYFCVFMLHISILIFYHGIEWVNFYSLLSPAKPSSLFCRIPKCYELQKCIKNSIPGPANLMFLHSQVRIFEVVVNSGIYFYIPILLVFGGGFFIGTTWASIRLYSVVPMPFFLALPACSLASIVVLVTLFPVACKLHESSSLILSKLKLFFARSGYWSRRVKAERSFRLCLGPFCKAKRSTMTSFSVLLVDYTINALLLDS